MIEILRVVIELGLHRVLRHQIGAGQASSRGAAHLKLFRRDLRLQPAQLAVSGERSFGRLLLGSRQRQSRPVLGHGANAIFGGKAERHGQIGLGGGLLIVHGLGGLPVARQRQFGLFLR